MLKITPTLDGSNTLTDENRQETYHSVNGAVQESMHVFIQHGLKKVAEGKTSVNVFEMGFGTGLNTLLTCVHKPKDVMMAYYSVEAFPVEVDLLKQMKYEGLGHEKDLYHSLIDAPFGVWKNISPGFLLRKEHTAFLKAELPVTFFDLVYYDAFGPKVQPELWTQECMQKCYGILKQGGILVTYCAQGEFKRNLKTAGFEVEELPGPPGKRVMTRAIKG
ncbi:MAG TPA: tRNA (5-methylaminomethyl-2-thiouridine)(34)-methyltransferase MnmD [Flavobacteriales bacterium]|nr:tRNA (5-methylaminomethyl-2-thiouridine)(34)-methyltransferase MnmD [Flavobacteriales bacterium]